MFGIRFVKFEPHFYVLQFKKGRLVKEGRGLSFFYYAPNTSMVALPVGSREVPFIFSVGTNDFQTVTVQGQVTYRIQEPHKVSELMNFTLDSKTLRPLSDDAEKLPERVINGVNVIANKEIGALPLTQAIQSQEALTAKLLSSISQNPEVKALGLEILGLSILAIRPNPDTARALEAQTREKILKEADDAIYLRRNAALEQERKIKENELNTEIAVEVKKRQIRETQMEADRMVQEKRQELENSAKTFQIEMEKKNQTLVEFEAKNLRVRAEAKAHELQSVLKAMEGTPPQILQVLASAGMSSERLIALAFQSLAGNAEKIGSLNISPELLSQLIASQNK